MGRLPATAIHVSGEVRRPCPRGALMLWHSRFNSRSGELEVLYDRNQAPPSLTGSFSFTPTGAGVFFFQTEASYATGTCRLFIVKATEEAREHIIQVRDDGIVPASIVITEGDRIWWRWDKKHYSVHLFFYSPGRSQKLSVVELRH
eukprot:m.134452 g.134452  ORF g.134452 m.134452 type:complete len:146 (+) comp38139_c0_seq23:532-969(+)